MNEFWEKDLNVGYYDKIVNKGMQNKKGVQSFWHILTLKKVSKYLEKNLDHLDYACGPGTLIGLFSNSNSTGIDIAAKQIEYANLNYSNKGVFKKINDYELNNKKFDVITILGLIEFISDDEIIDLLKTLGKNLNDSGKIILTTPNYAGLMNFYEVLLNKFSEVDYAEEHINKINTSNLLSLFKDLDNFEFNIKKFMNLSLFFSIFSHSIAEKIENFIGKMFKNYFGSLIIVELIKK